MLDMHAIRRFWRRQTDATRLCLATALGTFIVDGALLVLRAFTSDLMRPGGLSVIGLFYLLLAFAGITWRSPQNEKTMSVDWQYPKPHSKSHAEVAEPVAVSQVGDDG